MKTKKMQEEQVTDAANFLNTNLLKAQAMQAQLRFTQDWSILCRLRDQATDAPRKTW